MRYMFNPKIMEWFCENAIEMNCSSCNVPCKGDIIEFPSIAKGRLDWEITHAKHMGDGIYLVIFEEKDAANS